MNDNRSITCVKIDNKEIKHVAYGKITTFSLFCSEKKHMVPHGIQGYYSIRRFS